MLIKNAEVGQNLVGKRSLDLLGMSEDTAALALSHSLDDGAGQLDVLACNQTDLLGEIAGRLPASAADR